MNAVVEYVETVTSYQKESVTSGTVLPFVSPMGARGKRDAALIYAETRLKAWAHWARDCRGAMGLPTISMLYKAMRQKAVRIKSQRVRLTDTEKGGPEYTARGSETSSFVPPKVAEAPDAISIVDQVVAKLPPDLHEIIVTDFFSYGPIEVRCKKTRWKRARYSQLLEAAKYSVYAGLMAAESSRSDF